jgi:hypothetical protein
LPRRATRLRPNRSSDEFVFFDPRKGDDLEQTICAWTRGVKGLRLPSALARTALESTFDRGAPAV